MKIYYQSYNDGQFIFECYKSENYRGYIGEVSVTPGVLVEYDEILKAAEDRAKELIKQNKKDTQIRKAIKEACNKYNKE